MSGRVRAVIVTGAAGGIGAASCARLRREGYWVVGTDQVQAAGGECDAYASIDLEAVGESDAAATDAASTLRRLADRRPIHGLVHSAALQLVGKIEFLSVSDLTRTLAVNVVAPFALTRELATDLRAAQGSVVLVTSIHSRLTKPGFALYATSKSAMSGLMRSLALELAPVVRVNAVSPAATDTAMLRDGFGANWGEAARRKLDEVHPLHRIARPDEVADTIAYLLSSQASFVTATELEVGGGIHACLHDPA